MVNSSTAYSEKTQAMVVGVWASAGQDLVRVTGKKAPGEKGGEGDKMRGIVRLFPPFRRSSPIL